MFLSWILLIAVVGMVSLAGIAAWDRLGTRGRVMDEPEGPVEVKEANAAAVARGAIGDVQFDVVRYGYRQDQVDAVLAQVAQILRENGAETLRESDAAILREQEVEAGSRGGEGQIA
ncbi:DivIVA domain-containing protein [Corynebacterium lizhenjunii]|uniref:DivIVA domain-containing protein n=1 Tax=Corynebacterium lizhenjunii TaxID=2709394 RepID=UPI0013EB1FBC|nr:DivIVA domain-containing protein [Corynebacterium lizhenjunii]